jgi:VanZ family protein
MTVPRWLTVAWIVGTLIALGMPVPAIPEAPSGPIDKLAHLLLFAAGTVVALAGWPKRSVWVIALLAAFAPLTELWQAVLPTGREAELPDVLANWAGIGLGWVVARLAGIASSQRA